MAKTFIIATAIVAAATQVALAQDAQKGQVVFNICLACHSIGPGAQNKVGPELNGLDGRHSGSAPNFDYSDANKKSGIVWGEEIFKKYIQNPQGIVPGTKTIFPGIKNEQQVNDLCAYVSQFNAVGTKNRTQRTTGRGRKSIFGHAVPEVRERATRRLRCALQRNVIQAIRFEVVERLSDDDHLELLRARALRWQPGRADPDGQRRQTFFNSFFRQLHPHPAVISALQHSGRSNRV
jgi:cytochrome c